MRLGFFTMPMHPPSRNYTQTLKEDREAILIADRLGYHEAYIGEHLSDVCETIPSCLSFIASVAHDTRTIRLGSGTVNLPNTHPAAVASHVAMIDHMLEGRFIFGIGPGGLRSDMEVMGNIDADRSAMFVECIDHVLALWSGEPPYDLKGRYWNVSTARSLLPETGMGVFIKPWQQPHPPIVVTVVAAASRGLEAAAARGWEPISANFIPVRSVATHWPSYAKGCEAGGLAPDANAWRVVRSVFVGDDDARARAYARDRNGPHWFYYWNLIQKRKALGGLAAFKHDPSLPDDAVTPEYLVDQLVIAGGVERVVQEVLELRQAIGPFGSLLYCGHDWVDPVLAKRSMELMALEVMPRVNRAIGEA